MTTALLLLAVFLLGVFVAPRKSNSLDYHMPEYEPGQLISSALGFSEELEEAVDNYIESIKLRVQLSLTFLGEVDVNTVKNLDHIIGMLGRDNPNSLVYASYRIGSLSSDIFEMLDNGPSTNPTTMAVIAYLNRAQRQWLIDKLVESGFEEDGNEFNDLVLRAKHAVPGDNIEGRREAMQSVMQNMARGMGMSDIELGIMSRMPSFGIEDEEADVHVPRPQPQENIPGSGTVSDLQQVIQSNTEDGQAPAIMDDASPLEMVAEPVVDAPDQPSDEAPATEDNSSASEDISGDFISEPSETSEAEA